ncbi:hypothetical protein BFL38_14285 [Brachyspira hampsonii]|uniref:FtsK domain-containing protein n=2 Tax=Brachyspira hampsonii TaxID=1287055 RepID=A0A1E5NH19_9SPIR|nr:hypothetical protein BFL38_14285 [Brachyspira hampsonii]
MIIGTIMCFNALLQCLIVLIEYSFKAAVFIFDLIYKFVKYIQNNKKSNIEKRNYDNFVYTYRTAQKDENKEYKEYIKENKEDKAEDKKENTKKEYNYPNIDLLNESKETIYNNYIDIEEIEIILKESRISINYIFKYYNSIIKSYTLSTLENSLKCLFGDNIRLNKYYASKTLAIEYIKTDDSRYFGIKEVINDDDNFELPLYLGINTDNEKTAIDLAKAPHMLIAGETGSGKSVCLSSIITSLIYKKTTDELELILIDKKNELSIFNELPHLIYNSLNNDDDIISALRNLEGELRDRNNKITKKGARNIQEYNKKARNKLPYIVLIIDELQDLFNRDIKKEAEKILNTIASLGRSAGIHIIAATQRPSAKVITGELKANLPTKIALSVANNTDSRVIIDHKGAEDLIGNGDALLKRKESVKLEHIQVPYVTTEEIERIIDYINK